MNRSRKLLKWIGIVLGGLVGLVALALVVLLGIGSAKANQRYDVPAETIAIPSDSDVDALARGAHLAIINMCTDCHTESFGGQLYFTVPGLLSIPTPNLTRGRGGVGGFYTDADWVRAIRHGVGHDGRALFIMPSTAFHHLSDENLGDLIAFLKHLPPVDNELPARRIELMARVMMAVGMFPPFAADQIDHANRPPAAPTPGVTAAYGEYLTHICTECHGEHLNGKPFGPPGEEVPTPNLTPGGELATWSEEEFLTTMHMGITPSGRQLDEEMPWKYFGQMSDAELKAVWLYLQSLSPLAQGG